MTPVERFAEAAAAYCAWCDHQPQERTEAIELAQARAALRHLAELLRLVLDLRKPEVEETDDGQDNGPREWDRVSQSVVVPFGFYGVVLEPHADPAADSETALGDLTDDLADIYVDVEEGLRAYRAGKFAEAEWSWRFTFECHWGQHATEALAALYRWFQTDLDRWDPSD